MQIDMKKLIAFEYLVYKFMEWHEQNCPSERVELAFSKLKVIKLHFFATAISTNPDEDGLLNVFNNFHALPYGHVESEIYDNLHLAKSITVDKYSVLRNNVDASYFDCINDIKFQLDNSIYSLQEKNKLLVGYNAMELVELSHSWYSWKTTFNKARLLKKFSLPIPRELIKNEEKVFVLDKSIF
jgi:uncharacterized phage-associated protein